MSKNRLLNKLFEDENFLVDEESLPYIVRDIINMNWWNTCYYLLGYKDNHRVCLEFATKKQKLFGIILKEFYRHDKEKMKDIVLFEEELRDYILGENKNLAQLKLHSLKYRKNETQYFYKDGKATWLDCTSRATYAWKYVGQNGFVDFDDVCRVLDGDRIIKHCEEETVYPYKEELLSMFAKGENQVKKEIFSQRKVFLTTEEWCCKLGIKVIPSREWLFEKVKHVRTDPYKNYEKELLKKGELLGNNELLYGFKTSSSVEKASNASDASGASRASRASRASNASDASGASDASHASRASKESSGLASWFNVKTAIGELEGLAHPPVFAKNKFGLAGHWKINKELVESCSIGWLDVFMGHGESPLFAKKLGKNYVGIEINPESMNGYLLPYVQRAVNEHGDPNVKVELRLGDSMVFYPEYVEKFDLCYTSPPYFDFEDYGFHNKIVQECLDYDEYHKRVTVPVFSNVKKYLVNGGILAIQTEKDVKLKNKWIQVILSLGFRMVSDTITGQEKTKYSNMSKRDQSLLIFVKQEITSGKV